MRAIAFLKSNEGEKCKQHKIGWMTELLRDQGGCKKVKKEK